MTVSVSQLAKFAAKHAAGHKGATATGTGAGTDGLGDFMALLDQLGITLPADGSEKSDLLALLGKADALGKDGVNGLANSLDKLSAKVASKAGDATAAMADAILAAANGDAASGDGKSDPATALADLLDALNVQSDDSDGANTNATPDMAHILALLNAMAARPATAPEAAAPAQNGAMASVLTNAPASNPVKDMMERMRAALNLTQPTDGSGDAPAETDAPQPQFGERFAALRDALQSGQETPAPASTAGATAGAKIADLIARLAAQDKGATAAPAAAPQPDVASLIASVRDDRKNITDAALPQATDTGFTVTDPLLAGATGTTQPVDPAAAADPASASQSSSETLVKHHLDLARDSEWLDTLARDIARAAQHDSHLRFQLNPEHLGSLKVELINSAQGTSVKLTADTEAARAILTDAQPRLVAEARAQGLRISEATVDLGGQGSQQRQNAEQVVVIRTPVAPLAAEVEQNTPAGSGERYA